MLSAGRARNGLNPPPQPKIGVGERVKQSNLGGSHDATESRYWLRNKPCGEKVPSTIEKGFICETTTF